MSTGRFLEELSENVMVETREYSVAWEILGYNIDKLWHYPVHGVSCGPAPGQEMHQVLSWGWVVGEYLADMTMRV